MPTPALQATLAQPLLQLNVLDAAQRAAGATFWMKLNGAKAKRRRMGAATVWCHGPAAGPVPVISVG